MSLVIDASIVLAWYLEDEATPQTDAIFEGVARTGAFVPSLWHLEIANSFRTAIRRKRMTQTYRDASLADLSILDISTDSETHSRAWSAILNLSDTHGLTVYDAAYLELAIRRQVALATLDTQLAEAARRANVAVLP